MSVTLKDLAITCERADALLLWLVRTVYLPAVLKLCRAVDARAPGRANRLRLQPGRLAASTLRKRVNAGRWADVPAECGKWSRGGGWALRGLVLSRAAEVALI